MARQQMWQLSFILAQAFYNSAFGCEASILADREVAVVRALQDAIAAKQLKLEVMKSSLEPLTLMPATAIFTEHFAKGYATSGSSLLSTGMIIFKDGDQYFGILSNAHVGNDEAEQIAAIANAQVFETGMIMTKIENPLDRMSGDVLFAAFVGDPRRDVPFTADSALSHQVYTTIVRRSLPAALRNAEIEIFPP